MFLRRLSAETHSVVETVGLAEVLAAQLLPSDVVCLSGDLGAGKTTFVKGVLAALGADERIVTSPTFTLENRYPLTGPSGISLVVHSDLYRMDGRVEEDLYASLLEAREEGALILVEWAEAIRELLAPCFHLQLTVGAQGAGQSTLRELVLTHSEDEFAPALVEGWTRGARA